MHTDFEKNAVKTALEECKRAEKAHEKAHEKALAHEQQALARYEAARARARDSKLKRTADAVLTARQRLNESKKHRIEIAARLREATKILREQEQLAREHERKERARERAVARFLKNWEREYDLEMQRKKKNIKLRKQHIRRD